LVNCEVYAPYTVLTVTPSQDQTRKYSHDRLGPTIETSPAVRAMISSNLDNVYEKEFYSGSKIYLSYTKDNADRARGITSDQLNMDEVQDMILGLVEPVLEESMFTSRHKRKRYGGTPKSMSNGIEQRLWRQSDQREWMVRCHHHGPLPFHQKMTLANVGTQGPICKRCGAPLNTLDGQWVRTCTRMEQGKEPQIHGYHIPQIIFPTTDIEVAPDIFGILDWPQFLRYIEDNDEATVLNEKFGESADSESRPISEDELRAVCANDMHMVNDYAPWMQGQFTFAGIDWGQGSPSATVLVIGQFCPSDPKLFDYVYFKKYAGRDTDPKTCIPDILRLLALFRVHRVHCDWGSGFGLNSQLRDALGDEVVTANYWHSGIKNKIQYNIDINAYVLNRTVHLARFFQAFKQRQMRVRMAWNDFWPCAKDVLAEFKEERRDGTVYFDHKLDEPDDGMHAMIYCWFIASLNRYGTEGIEYTRGQEHFPMRT
jgi:hypothetical protein